MKLLTPAEVAAILRLSYRRTLDRINSGDIPATNVGGSGTGRRLRVREADLNRFLEARSI